MSTAASTFPAEAPPITPRVRRWLPRLVAMALFMENLDATIVNTAVPTISASLAVAPLELKGVMASYTLSLAVFIPISGWMADRWGTRRVFAAAITIFLVGSICCGAAVNLPMLVASRVLQGMGGAMMTPVGRLALVRSFPRPEILAVMNYVVVPALIGPLVGPSLGGLIVHWLHWRVIFFLNVPFALAGLWAVRGHMPDFRDEHVPPLDYRGFVLFGAGTALLSYVLEVFGEHRLPLSTLGAMTAVALALLGGYYWNARRVTAPVLALRLLKVRTFRVSVIGGFVTRLGVGGMPFLLPLLYQLGLGYTPWQAGLLTVPQALSAMAMKMFSRGLLRRFGHKTILVVNTVLLGLTMSTFSLVSPGTPVWVILLISFTQGFFSSLQFSSINTLTYADVSDDDASKASSLSSTAQQMSLSFGVAFASVLAELFLGRVDQRISAQVIPALHKAFLAMGLLTVVSSAVFWKLRRHDGYAVSHHTGAARPDPSTVEQVAMKPS